MDNNSKKYSLERYDSVHALPLKYNKIFSQYSNDEIFLSQSWFELFENSVVCQDGRVRIYGLVLKSDPEAALLLLPLWEQPDFGGIIKTLSSLGNYYTGNYEPLYAKNKITLREIFFVLLDILIDTEDWHLINLRSLTHSTLEYKEILDVIAKQNHLHQQYFMCGNWFLDTKSKHYDAIKNNRPGSLRSTLARKGKKFTKKDGATIEIFTGKQIDQQRIKDYWSVYDNSWKSEEMHKQFIDNLLTRCAEAGKAVLGLAYINGKPIAAQIWLVGGNTAYIYKLAHLAEYDRLSVGTILLDSIMQYVHATCDIYEVDFLTGDDKYKSQWMGGRREKWGVIIFNKKTLPGLASGYINIYGQKIKRFLLPINKTG